METQTQSTRELPANFWQTQGLTLENFSDMAFQQTGHRIRFRRTKDQVTRGLTRAEAFAETFVANQK